VGFANLTDRLFVITDDEQGTSNILTDALRRRGAHIALIQIGDSVGEVDEDVYTADLTDAVHVDGVLQLVRRRFRRPIAGVIHLLPLRPGPQFTELDLAAWRTRLLLEVETLFCLAKAASPDLRQDGDADESWLIAATTMGGMFGSAGATDGSFSPSQGGVAGLVKTLALEWPNVRSSVVDFEAGADPQVVADHLLAEIMAGDLEVEVGYQGGRRLAFRARPAPLEPEGRVDREIDSSSVVLVTGGARGITAEVAHELAERYRPTLLLMGRTPLPASEERPETVELTSQQALKTALMDQLRRAGQPAAPAQVEAAYVNLLRDREVRRNLAAMERVGALVRYYQVDGREEATFGDLIEDIYRVYGRLDGVIHGAGIIEDKLIEDKTSASFNRVVDTKVASAFVLCRHLRPDSLKFLVFFSSVAGRFGNPGQGDYAAANEVLNKLALYLDRQWPGRVVSINWGPWEKTGMASSGVQRLLAERGLQLIPPSTGRRLLDQELRFGRKGEVEVILGAGPWGIDAVRETMPIVDHVDPPLHKNRPMSYQIAGRL
jgi:NAD(P)-dependent dehydrogenase (short-subunit alcohol dehydrogenase family)